MNVPPAATTHAPPSCAAEEQVDVWLVQSAWECPCNSGVRVLTTLFRHADELRARRYVELLLKQSSPPMWAKLCEGRTILQSESIETLFEPLVCPKNH